MSDFPANALVDRPSAQLTPTGQYALITPARNEERFIERTILSVVNQSRRPVAWMIVDDGSNDGTADIISRYAAQHAFIRLVRLQPQGTHRGFERKAAAFRTGFGLLTAGSFDYVGNLDADIVVPIDYYENILREFDADPKLGLAGGIVYTKCGEHVVTSDTAIDSVGGAIQLFRYACFRDIGGYLALPVGGIDAAAEITARMMGWTVRKFPIHKVYEQRPTGSAHSSIVARYVEGIRCYSLGYSFSFYAARCAYKISRSPRIVGSIAALVGFLCARLRNMPVLVRPEVVSYLRDEQAKKLRALLSMKGWTS